MMQDAETIREERDHREWLKRVLEPISLISIQQNEDVVKIVGGFSWSLAYSKEAYRASNLGCSGALLLQVSTRLKELTHEIDCLANDLQEVDND